MTAFRSIHRSAPNQRGAVLFVALVFLVLLTLLGLVASGNSVLQERMLGGLRSQQLGLMGAESALRGGEFAVWSAAQNASLSEGGDSLPPCNSGQTFLGAGGALGCAYDRSGGIEHYNVTRFRSSRAWPADGELLVQGANVYQPEVTGLSGNVETASIVDQPQYLIEDLGLDASGNGGVKGRMAGARLQEGGGSGGGAPPRRLYRITARSPAGNPNGAVSVVESVYSAYGTNHQYNPDAPPSP